MKTNKIEVEIFEAAYADYSNADIAENVGKERSEHGPGVNIKTVELLRHNGVIYAPINLSQSIRDDIAEQVK